MKTNCTSHLIDDARLSENSAKRTGQAKQLIPSNLILKIVKPFIRRCLNPALDGETGLRMKTNCTIYLIDNAQLIWKSAKRTEQVKDLNQKDLILKILNPFIRCHRQIGSRQEKGFMAASPVPQVVEVNEDTWMISKRRERLSHRLRDEGIKSLSEVFRKYGVL